ncbi:6403_t:CDS:2, partial [Diversispora eburnea]
FLKEEIANMLKNELIQKSFSSWSIPIVMLLEEERNFETTTTSSFTSDTLELPELTLLYSSSSYFPSSQSSIVPIQVDPDTWTTKLQSKNESGTLFQDKGNLKEDLEGTFDEENEDNKINGILDCYFFNKDEVSDVKINPKLVKEQKDELDSLLQKNMKNFTFTSDQEVLLSIETEITTYPSETADTIDYQDSLLKKMEQVIEDLQEAKNQAQDRIAKSQSKQQLRYQVKTTIETYNIGGLVLLYRMEVFTVVIDYVTQEASFFFHSLSFISSPEDS